jgi:hypothetical protein
VSKRNHLRPSVDRERCDAVHELEDVGWIVAVVRHLAHGGKDPAYPDQPGDPRTFPGQCARRTTRRAVAERPVRPCRAR